MRYERKYRIEALDLESVFGAIRDHALSFRTLYPDRQVNNIYLDTQDLSFFRENLAGIAQRRKYRIRWYGEDIENLTNPILEMKLKDTELGTKIMAKLEDFSISNYAAVQKAINTELRSLTHGEKAKDLPPVTSLEKVPESAAAVLRRPHPIQSLHPSLINTYLRSYFISYDGKFRLTVDRHMRFHRLDQRFAPYRNYAEDDAIVVEVKYEQELDIEYDRVGQHLPFRLTKNSKYVNGVMMIGNA
ncbi:MAG: VTC domain-containing protein [Bacteroidota bacterium]